MLPGGSRTACVIYNVFPWLDLYFADPAQQLITAGQDLDYLLIVGDLSDLICPTCEMDELPVTLNPKPSP